ncbi:hypothetical protein A6R68_22376, partial [Neotoma lepida]
SIYPSVYLSISLSIYLSIYPHRHRITNSHQHLFSVLPYTYLSDTVSQQASQSLPSLHRFCQVLLD